MGGDFDSIDVVSVKELGAKHKLLVVDACGDRFLLTASDKEVRLLRHLNNGEGGAGNPIAEKSIEKKTPEFSESDFAEMLRRSDSNVSGDIENSEDLSGLIRLRAYQGKAKKNKVATHKRVLA